SKRVVNREALEAILEPVFRAKDTAPWLALLQAGDIPATPVNDLATALALPPLAERAMVDAALVGSPVARGRDHRRPPRLGEHTDEILAELGYDGAAVARLRAQGVV
ncbi:MAG: CoA transferase, partial [Planctomycetota bacterium]